MFRTLDKRPNKKLVYLKHCRQEMTTEKTVGCYSQAEKFWRKSLLFKDKKLFQHREKFFFYGHTKSSIFGIGDPKMKQYHSQHAFCTGFSEQVQLGEKNAKPYSYIVCEEYYGIY